LLLVFLLLVLNPPRRMVRGLVIEWAFFEQDYEHEHQKAM